MSLDYIVRQASVSDAGPIAALSAQLGYPNTTDNLQPRLTSLLSRDDNAIFIAETVASEVMAWIHVMPRLLLISDPIAEIGGLVVDENRRRCGVGSALIGVAERWAASKGYEAVIVRSNAVRSDAHSFYQALDYENIRTQKVFTKPLTP